MTVFKDQFVAATTCEVTASDQRSLQPPGGKLSISNCEVRARALRLKQNFLCHGGC